MERKYFIPSDYIKTSCYQKTKSVWGEVEEGTGKGKITIFITSKSHNKTALRQNLVLALLVTTKYIYCPAAVTMHHGMVTKSANNHFFGAQPSRLPHHLSVFFLFFLTKNWHKEMGWENATARFICSSLFAQLWVLNSSVYIAFGLFPKWIAIKFCKLFIITLFFKSL